MIGRDAINQVDHKPKIAKLIQAKQGEFSHKELSSVAINHNTLTHQKIHFAGAMRYRTQPYALYQPVRTASLTPCFLVEYGIRAN
jgi:hypothetical protein